MSYTLISASLFNRKEEINLDLCHTTLTIELIRVLIL